MAAASALPDPAAPSDAASADGPGGPGGGAAAGSPPFVSQATAAAPSGPAWWRLEMPLPPDLEESLLWKLPQLGIPR